MSFRNLFIIKMKNNENVDDIYFMLDKYMKYEKYGIKFEPMNYYDEILNLLHCNKNFFILTNDKIRIECEEIFDIEDAFKYALSFPKKEFEKKEKKYLYRKLCFINEIIKIIFYNDKVDLVEVYISPQFSQLLEDFSLVVNVKNYDFVDALLESYNPTRKCNYFGMKTSKFIINNVK